MNEPHPLGHVFRLWRYPTKSLRAEPLERAVVESDGVRGDRRRALVVSTPEHARTGRTYRGKEHNLLHTLATESARSTRRSGAAWRSPYATTDRTSTRSPCRSSSIVGSQRSKG